MTEQQGLNLSPSPQNSQPLESSFGGDLSDPQMLDQILNQLLAQLPEPLTSPQAIAGMIPQMLTGQGLSQPVAAAQSQSSSQSPKQPEAQPQQTTSGQSPEQLLSDAQQQLSSLQGLGQIIDPIMSEAQPLMSGLESLDLLGAEAQQQLSRGSTPDQMAGTSQQSPDLQGKTPTSAPSKSVPQGDTSGSALMPEISSAQTPNLSPTQTSEAATKSTTAPSTATEANRPGRQVPSQSPSSENGMTGMGDLSLSEFLPDSAELQRLFEQGMAAVLPTKPALPASPQFGSDQMGAAGSTSTVLQNPEQVGSEVEPKAKTVLNPEQPGAVGQQSSPDIQGKTPASSQPASLFDGSSPDFYFLPNLSSTMSSDASTLPDGSAAGNNMVAPEQIGRAIETQSRELQGQGEREIGNLKQLGGRTTSKALAQVEMLPGAEFLTILEEGVGRIPLSEADLHQSVTEPPAAVPLPPGSTPKFYFLPDSKPAESNSSKPFTEQQTSQLPQDGFDVEAVRRDFPILHQQVHGKPLIWMDNAATSQKPQSVIDTLSQFYEQDNSNVHRGAHTLAARSTNAYEDAREKIQLFLGASLAKEIVFVRGTTEGINLVAQTYGRKHVKAGDEIVLTTLEHHSNIVPWQMLAQEKGAVLKVAPISDQGEILLEEYQKLLSDRTRIVALSHVSNVLGTVLPIKTMAAMAHRHGATVVVDGAQSVPHFRTNVQDLGADFYVFSGHKLFGPTGIGALYGKAALLKEMPPWQGGGNMIESVSFEKTTFNDIPAKFEAGTGNLAAAVGLGAAIDYLNQIGFEAAAKHEEALMAYATAAMAAIPGLRQIGTAAGKVSTLSFTLKNISSEDMGKFLDSEGIAVRAGHHCAQPTLKRFGLTSTVRPSLAFYNTFGEVDKLIAAIKKAKHQLS